MEQNKLKSDMYLEFTLNIFKNYGIPAHSFHSDSDIIECMDLGLRTKILKYATNTIPTTDVFKTLPPENIYLISDVFDCNYFLLFSSDGNIVHSIGPFLLHRMNKEHFITLIERLNLPQEYDKELFDYYQNVTFLPSYRMAYTILTEVGRQLHGAGCDIVPIRFSRYDKPNLDLKQWTRIPDEQTAYLDILTTRYEVENNLVTALVNYNYKGAMELLNTLKDIYPMIPAKSVEPLRKLKNTAIGLLAIIRKGLELNNIHPIYYDNIINDFGYKVEICNSKKQLHDLQDSLVERICNAVKQFQHKDHSPFVDAVITYVDTDLSADLSLNALAKYLNVNASYLSSLFAKEMGVSLTSYVTTKRIDMAKHLLILSEISIKQIAEQCGFTDIHYFSRVFKKMAGLSPKKFQEAYSGMGSNVLNNKLAHPDKPGTKK